MYERPLRYLVRVFTPGCDLDLARVSVLAKTLAGSDMLLSTVQQLDSAAGLMMSRVQLTSADRRWAIHLPAPSIDVAYMPLPSDRGAELPFKDVVAKSSSFISELMEAHGTKSSRLAVAQEGFLPDESEATKQAWAAGLFRFTKLFRTHTPFEWTWRCASLIERKFGEASEPTNTSVTVKRVHGIFRESGDRFDRLQVDLDINTSSEKSALRFGSSDVQAFMARIPEWHAELNADLIDSLPRGGV